MAVDPQLSLASSVHAAPGTFALLLGSGISAPSGVLTGWQVTMNLIGRLAALEGEDPGEDLAGWYTQRSGNQPDYSELLTVLAPSAADRRNLLEKFFEPTEEEREQGLKLPTNAHRAIAALVAKGYIRVIVTTNFDRLLEMALAEAGVQPHVVSGAAHAAGAVPLAHSRCTIIKVHGDYLSPDLKNTVDELGSYDPAIDSLLDEVFDQYGLVVCGWSGVWDAALRAAVLRAPGRRYATYWTHRGPVDPQAGDMVRHRDAIDVPIGDADSFFEAVAEKVEVLTELADQRPQGTAVMVAQLKRYLPDESHRIRLHDLVTAETEAVVTAVTGLPTDGGSFSPDRYRERLQVHERAMATLTQVLMVGAYFGDTPRQDDLWVRAVDRLAHRKTEGGGSTLLVDSQQYPTTLALYAVGIGAIAAGRIDPIGRALATVEAFTRGEPRSVALAASSWASLNHDAMKQSFPELADRMTPISEHLSGLLKLELTRLGGHLILGREALEEGDPDGSSIEVPRGVPSRSGRAGSVVGPFDR